MGQQNAPHIVVYVLSSVIMGGNGFNNLNQFNRQSAIKDYYCYWHGLCQGCCYYTNIPTGDRPITHSSYGAKPTTTSHLSRSGILGLRRTHLQNSRTLNYSMLHRNSPAVRFRHMDEYRNYLIRSLANSGHLPHQLSLNKINVNRPINTTKSDSGTIINNIMPSRRELIDIAKPEIEVSVKTDEPLSEINLTQSIAPSTEDPEHMEDITTFVDFSSSSTRDNPQLPELLKTKDVQSNERLSGDETRLSDSYILNQQAIASENNFHYGGRIVDDSFQENSQTGTDILFGKFRATLDKVERKLLLSTFTKLTAISPENRQVNGISFLQSGFFLHQLLMSLTMGISQDVTVEIEERLGLNMTVTEKMEVLKRTAAWLPKSSDVLKFRWSSRVVLRHAVDVSVAYRRAARAMRLNLSWLNGTETSAEIAQLLNDKVMADSGGTMHDTFEEEELSGGVCGAALSTLYVRATWRSAPTLLNDTLPFRDAPPAPHRTSRFFRLNDLMAYAYLHEWDTEAIEISYAMPGLTLLILVPKTPSLKPLLERFSSNKLDSVLGVMQPMRLSVTLPLYTLRMTLLLPNKLQDMGISTILTNDTDCQSVKFSHAVQRLMFWAEAGRNAFKDDGIEWDPHPELEVVVDRPYLFFVRWQNVTIMNGAFVL